jgi:AraC-like DNA-binding protein
MDKTFQLPDELHWLEKISPTLRPVYRSSPVTSFSSHGVAPPGWLEPRRCIYDYELVFFPKGRFVVEIKGERYECDAKTFIIIPPEKWHVTYNIGDCDGHRYWTHFDWVYAPRELDDPYETYHPGKPQLEKMRWPPDFIPKKIQHGKIAHFDEVMKLMERLCQMTKGGNDRNLLAGRAVLLEILFEIILPTASTEIPPPYSMRMARQVRDLLDKMNSEKRTVSIQDALASSGYTYAHLCRIFKKEYGLSPCVQTNR